MATRAAFIDEVVDDITEGRTIPATPNEKRMNGIIDRALKFFKEKSDDAVEFEYIILKNEVFQTDLFKNKRQVQLPSCVNAITNVRLLGNVLGGGNGEIDKDYRKSNLNAALLAGGGNSQDMLTGVVQQFYNDFLNNFQLRTVGYEYNEHTNMLTIIGKDPSETMMADAYVHVPDEAFFNMDMFFRYVVGKCKESFASSFTFVKQKTIGGREINASDIKADGKEMIKEVKQEIKEQENFAGFWTEY